MYPAENAKHLSFIRSALALEGARTSCDEALEWAMRRREEVHVKIEPMKLSKMADWYFDEDNGRVRHKSGRFFSIDGIRVETSVGLISTWDQPIINQPEIGFLGCITHEIDGILHFLVQAKIEPGNVNVVQLSPTLQATRSNYTRQHKGAAPRYLEYFLDRSRARVLLDQLQSEQGARFLNKRNRNIIVQTDEDIPESDDFRWLTLGQIKKLCALDNVVNMDLRTVISGIPVVAAPFEHPEMLDTLLRGDEFKAGMMISALNEGLPKSDLDQIISWLTELKSKNDLHVERIPLSQAKQWILTDDRLHHEEERFFDVRWVQVEIENREVARWHQPIVEPREEGLIAFIVKKINGVHHFLVQAKVECGNFDTFEFAPTVQCITGSYKNSFETVPFLKYVLEAKPEQIRFDALQSEEGGRFYREQNRNLIVEVGDDFPTETPLEYEWMTLHQMLEFIRFNNYLNVQARSLLAGIRFA